MVTDIPEEADFCGPESPGDLPGIVVMNPEAIGNPDETPRVFVGIDAAALFRPCAGCGGVNGWHAEDCDDA